MDREFKYVGFDFSSMVDLPSQTQDEEDFLRNTLELVREGVITPEDAEERAVERGMDSLISASWKGRSITEFRAWSIEMTVAWLVWRSTRAVQLFYNPYRTQCFEWMRVRNAKASSGYERRALKAATLGDVRAKASHSRKSLSYSDAVKALWDRLEKGPLSGSALTVSGNEYKIIAAEEWATLKLDINDQGEARLLSAFAENVVCYHSVTFRPDEIFREWKREDAQEFPVAEIGIEKSPPEEPDQALLGQSNGVRTKRNRHKPRPGRRLDWAWDTAIREEAIRLLNLHGDFKQEEKPKWRPARLIDLLLDFCSDKWDDAPGRSTMTNYARRYAEEFRKSKSAS